MIEPRQALLHGRGVEIDQQLGRTSRQPQVGHHLHAMDWVQFLYGLEFHDNLALDEKVDDQSIRQAMARILDRDPPACLNHQGSSSQLDPHTLLIHGLE